RIFLTITLPWYAYKRLFFLLGSNPGKGIQAHEKVLVQAITGLLLGYWIVFLTGWSDPTLIWIPLIGGFHLGLLMIPFVIFTVISMANAVNLSDGMDGLAAGLLLISFGGFLAISIMKQDTHNTILITSIIGSLITYLYFNAPPARFQMGDVGSLSLGTILAAVAFSLEVPFLLLIIGFPFVAEVGSSLLQGMARRILGRRIFAMAPLHHHLEVKGWNEEKVVIRFWIFGMVCAVFGVWMYAVFGL
ncbi:phospho-N-acetylmuramoyl-pentapeptide-transferase, partial [Candidatus Dojkabacteria bacterium]|nr:phospho-N-acetylmuramoyl-pentapeptide-transferase [Candidatus Dojkabacteria bacterium]